MHISHLVEGDRIRIKTGFTDFDGKQWSQGQQLLFSEQSYFPYDGGYTLTFDQGIMRLAEIVEENALVIRNEAEEFFELVD
jgi:hypothetical protein